MPAELIDSNEFRRISDAALNAARADHVVVRLNDRDGGTARFANNQVVQNVHARRTGLSVSVAFGNRHGASSVTDLSEKSVLDAVARAERIAQVCPPDPEYLPPLGPQEYAIRERVSADTVAAGPGRLTADAGEVIGLCDAQNLTAAGIVSASVSAVGLAASSGLFAYEQRSRADFSLTATGPDSTGWVKNADRSIDALGIVERARVAIDKAKKSAGPKEIEPGRYTVILEPAAVAGLFGPILWVIGAKSYHRGTSALSGRLGERIIDERLSLVNGPARRRLLGSGFNGQGMPADGATWINRGVLERLDYDRFTAQEHGVDPTYGLDAPVLSADEPTAADTNELIAQTKRGILVTNFWYIRFVNATDLTLTGMTRDGTFLIEDGKIASGLINFRWHDSPLRAFSHVEGFTAPTDAITVERTKMLLPAMRIGEFNFSSVTRF